MNKIYGAENLKEITNQIINWNYEPIKGIGVFSKTEKYAHIEISIDITENYTDEIIWSVKEEFIPVVYRKEIIEVLSFFANYLTALKGNRQKGIAFEIIDGSFDNDSGRWSFTYATMRSLVSCFDKEIFKVSELKQERINRAKKNGLSIIRRWAVYFSEEQILESLQDVALTSHIKSFLSNNEVLKLNGVLQLSQVQDIVGGRFLNNEIFIEKNVVTKYGDLSRIGFAHIALIVNNRAAFPYIGVFRLDLIEDKFGTT